MDEMQEFPLDLVPEVEDIMDYQPIGQQILVWPYKLEGLVTKNGIILNSDKSDIIRKGMLQRGKVVSAGKRCTEVEADMIVFYYNSAWRNPSTGGCLRQGDEMYVLMEEYGVKGYVKSSSKPKKQLKTKQSKETTTV